MLPQTSVELTPVTVPMLNFPRAPTSVNHDHVGGHARRGLNHPLRHRSLDFTLSGVLLTSHLSAGGCLHASCSGILKLLLIAREALEAHCERGGGQQSAWGSREKEVCCVRLVGALAFLGSADP